MIHYFKKHRKIFLLILGGLILFLAYYLYLGPVRPGSKGEYYKRQDELFISFYNVYKDCIFDMVDEFNPSDEEIEKALDFYASNQVSDSVEQLKNILELQLSLEQEYEIKRNNMFTTSHEFTRCIANLNEFIKLSNLSEKYEFHDLQSPFLWLQMEQNIVRLEEDQYEAVSYLLEHYNYNKYNFYNDIAVTQ